VAKRKTSDNVKTKTAGKTASRKRTGKSKASGNGRAAGGSAKAASKASEATVTTDRRAGKDRRAKVNRRRQIDPTTCERDYTPDEIEFMNAMDDYKRASGRMFPTCSEVLEVIRNLGYEKRPEGETPEPAAEGESEPVPAGSQASPRS